MPDAPQRDNESLQEFFAAEQAQWTELEGLVDGLTPEQAETPGYHPGWSVKDLLAHIAGWLSEAGLELEQIRAENAVEHDVDVDARNQIFVDANRDQPFSFVLFEAKAARRRLLHHLRSFPEIPPAAQAALRKAGPEHYAEHLLGLGEWVSRLRKASPPSP